MFAIGRRNRLECQIERSASRRGSSTPLHREPREAASSGPARALRFVPLDDLACTVEADKLRIEPRSEMSGEGREIICSGTTYR
jgi:hypothetical protein